MWLRILTSVHDIRSHVSRRMPVHMEDWIIAADMDEFATFGNHTDVHQAIAAMNADGSTFALGEMLDHVAHGGDLRSIDQETDIWTQFPLICPVISTIAHGLPAKVTIAKAYLRTGAGHHHIVPPPLAYAYFSDECTGVECELVMKHYKQRTLRDVYNMTPYSWYPSMYTGADGWQTKQYPVWLRVHHFKWHQGVLDNLHFRMVRDSGDCLLGVNEDKCQPIFQFWKEVARQYESLALTHSVNITSLKCKQGVDRGFDSLW